MSEDIIKDTLKRMPYGFYAITSRSGEEVNAMVANWVTQASFTPRLLAMAIQKSSYSHGVIKQGGVFALNLFLKGDQEVLMPFTKSRAKNPDKIKDARYSPAPLTGCPVLEGAAAYLECKVVVLHDIGGDHDMLVGEVLGAGSLKEGEREATLNLQDIGWSYAG